MRYNLREMLSYYYEHLSEVLLLIITYLGGDYQLNADTHCTP